MVLVGNLKDLKLVNIIQINCIERNVAKLTVLTPEKKGTIYFAGGQIVHAEFNPYLGERAVHEMLGLKDGQFKVENGIEAPAQTIHRPWNSVVLEGLRLLDEKQVFSTPIPKQVFSSLSEQPEVKNVFVLDYQGRLIEGKAGNRNFPAIVAFTWYKLKKSLSLFYSESFRYILIRKEANYLFILELKPHLVVIETDLRLLVPDFIGRVEKILRNIRKNKDE